VLFQHAGEPFERGVARDQPLGLARAQGDLTLKIDNLINEVLVPPGAFSFHAHLEYPT
jgi:hypothetical protein